MSAVHLPDLHLDNRDKLVLVMGAIALGVVAGGYCAYLAKEHAAQNEHRTKLREGLLDKMVELHPHPISPDMPRPAVCGFPNCECLPGDRCPRRKPIESEG